MFLLILGRFSQTIQAGLMSSVVSVGKVEAGHTKSGPNQAFQLGNLPTSRAQCTNDFGLARRSVRGLEDGL